MEYRIRSLFLILDHHPQFVRRILSDKERDDIVLVARRLDDFEQINHTDAEPVFLATHILFERLAVQFQVNETGFARVHGGDFHHRRGDDEGRLKDDVLEDFHQGPNNSALERANIDVTLVHGGRMRHCIFWYRVCWGEYLC